MRDDANTAYGSNLIVWDLVVHRQPPAAIGIADMPAFPRTWAARMAAPFG